MGHHFEQRRKQSMNLFGWWNKKKADKAVSLESPEDEKDICPECGGQGYIVNDNHYIADGDDYERRYFSCKRCHGTGRYHININGY